MRRNGCVFLVIEGIDGAGKSTLAKALQNTLHEKLPTRVFSEPTRFTDAGRKIRELLATEKNDDLQLAERLLRLFAIDREWHVRHKIRPALRNGENVILDRYYFSTAAYQGRDADAAEKILSYYNAPEFEIPDKVIFLNMQPSQALERIQNRGASTDVFETLENLTRISDNYNHILKKFENTGKLISLDASQPTETLLETILQNLDN